MSNPEIICVGMAVVDVLVEGVDVLPQSGETGPVSGVSLATGGDAINQAMSLAKLGHHVGLMGLIGEDVQGKFILGRCAEHGIDTDNLFVDHHRSTATSIMLIDNHGERSFLSQRNSAIVSFGPEHINLERIQRGLRALSVGSLFCAPRFDQEGLAPLLRRAKSVGAITIADMVADQQGYGLQGLEEAWPYLDYVLPSELEARLFSGRETPEGIGADLQKRGVKNVIIKRGSKGVAAFFGSQVSSFPAFEVEAVDTTGAGDNFVAGFIHGVVSGFAPDRSLHFASATAAVSIQAVGAGAGLKNLSRVEDFLSTHRSRLGPSP